MRVIIVEDNAGDALLMEKAAMEVGGPGTEVLVFETGEAAVEHLRERARVDASGEDRPDLLLVDLGLPEMSGFQFLEWLKEQELLSDTLVAVISAFHNLNAELARSLGATAYFKKPEDVGTYVKMLQRAVDTHAEHADGGAGE